MRPASVAAGIVLIGMLLSACSSPPAAAPTTTIAEERASRSEARVNTLLSNYGDYLASRWPGIELPETRIERWVDLGEWPSVFEECASEESGLAVRTLPTSGVFSEPVQTTDAGRIALDVSIYVCQGRFPPPNLARSDPGPIEIAWVTNYARVELPACLRRLGLIAPPLGSDPFAILSGGSTPQWDPYAGSRRDAAEVQRAQALCPHPSTLLAGLTAAGDLR